MEIIKCQEKRRGRPERESSGSPKVATQFRQGLDYIRDERMLQQRLTRGMDKNKPKGE